MTPPKVIELCSGYGGATAGMIAAGLEIEASFDLWPVAVAAHRRWHPDASCEVRDVSTITPDELAGRIVWASLPCQPWSTANRVRRGKAHSSYYSLAHFARQVQHAHTAILENVPGLLHEKDGQAELRELERECARLNLSLSINLIPAAWYGVRQLRRRAIIIIGGGLTLFTPPQQAFDNLESAPRATFGGGADSERYKAGLPRSATTNGNRPDSRSRQVNHVARSPADNALLQGVPMEYIAHLPATHQYTLIGNAVPPLFAEGVCRSIFGGIQGASFYENDSSDD